MKNSNKATLLVPLAIAVLAACDQIPTTAKVPLGAKAVVLTLTATKSYNPSASYSDGLDLLNTDTIITLPTSIGVISGAAGNGNRVALSFNGGTMDNLTGIRCYYTSSGGTSYAFSSCDGGAGGGGVLPYYSAGDAVLITAGDVLVLRVASGDNSAPTSVSVSIAGIQNQ